MNNGTPHIPVLLNEVLSCLNPTDKETYIDGTFGAGGYTRAFLDHSRCKVIALDKDETAYQTALSLKNEYGDRLIPFYNGFDQLDTVFDKLDLNQCDAIVLDIGVSSMQLDQGERGFSFRQDGPLDMRMDRNQDLSAATIINDWDEDRIADIFYKYGEEHKSRQIAKCIITARKEKPIETTFQLCNLIYQVKKKTGPKDPATKCFQALRIAVNDELGALERVLNQSLKFLREGARLIIVSFHSLEDRIVKQFFDSNAAPRIAKDKYAPQPVSDASAYFFDYGAKKKILPSRAEINQNPRARSAILRFGIRTSKPYMQENIS